MTNRRALLKTALLTGMAAPLSVIAQQTSSKPVRLIVPFAAGANSDVLTRAIAQRVTEAGGPLFMVENRPGAGGQVAAMALKKARPESLTLLVANTGSHAILPATQKLGYDPLKDFIPVAQLFSFPNFLIIPQRIKTNSVKALLSYGASNPQGLSYGSQGIASPGHLLGTMLEQKTGLRMVHVPYAGGGGPMNMDVVAGRLDMVFSTYASLKGHSDQGKVKFLAIASAQRSALMPDVPTTLELGYEGVELDAWFGLVAAASTPASVVASLQEAFAQAARSPDLVEKFRAQGVTLEPLPAAQFAQRMAKDKERLAVLAKNAAISL